MTDSKAWFEQGKKHERERIIALFENDKDNCPLKDGCPACEHLSRLIALIKGENE